MNLPDYVIQALVTAGKMTPDGLGRAAQLRTCPRCRQWVIVGLDHHRAAARAVCDPVALDRLGECAVILAGAGTYELWGKELHPRNQFSIAGAVKKPIVGDHDCGKTPRIPSREIIRLFIPVKAQQTNNERPPY